MYLWSELLTTFQTIEKLYNSTQMVYKRLGIKRIAMKSLKKELCTTARYNPKPFISKSGTADTRLFSPKKSFIVVMPLNSQDQHCHLLLINIINQAVILRYPSGIGCQVACF